MIGIVDRVYPRAWSLNTRDCYARDCQACCLNISYGQSSSKWVTYSKLWVTARIEIAAAPLHDDSQAAQTEPSQLLLRNTFNWTPKPQGKNRIWYHKEIIGVLTSHRVTERKNIITRNVHYLAKAQPRFMRPHHFIHLVMLNKSLFHRDVVWGRAGQRRRGGR